MQGFSYTEAAQDIQLSDDEAKALIALHARRSESRSQPNLHELASLLNISDAEAMTLLTELRAQNPARAAVPPMPMVSSPIPSTHRVPAYVWAVAVGVVVFWLAVGGLFLVRTSNATPAMSSEAAAPTYPTVAAKTVDVTPPMPVAPPEVPTRAIASTGESNVVIDDHGVVIKGKDGKSVVEIHSSSTNSAPKLPEDR